MSRKKSKAKSGTWVTREMIYSEAYWNLNSTAKGMLILFLMKRDMNSNHECVNCRSLTMTYKELEALHGANPDGTPKGIARTSISRGIADLMEKGFIDIVRQGGAYQKDKTVYALIEDWRRWLPGAVFKKKTPGKKAGYFALKKNSTTELAPIHTTELIPQSGCWGSEVIPIQKTDERKISNLEKTIQEGVGIKTVVYTCMPLPGGAFNHEHPDQKQVGKRGRVDCALPQNQEDQVWNPRK